MDNPEWRSTGLSGHQARAHGQLCSRLAPHMKEEIAANLTKGRLVRQCVQLRPGRLSDDGRPPLAQQRLDAFWQGHALLH
jgi:hypothetical protein